MRLPSLAGCALAILHAAVPAAAVASCPDGLCLTTRAGITPAQIGRELGPLLSKSAQIFGPTDPRWDNATERWQTFMPPSIQVVVEPGVEADIPTIVKYANRNSIPFLTVNRGHGFTATLGKFNGLQISMEQLRKITIADDGKSVLMQGGVYGAQVIDELWNAGYVTSTGSCGCVGLMGPTLGGGHGRLQGMYGLLSDGLIELNVVLADGSTVTVSDKKNPDLFWAMRGAGHNFGIVTSFKAKIWPRGPSTWYYRNVYFTQDKLEPLLDMMNKLNGNGNGTQPKELGHYGMYLKMAGVDDPVILWSFSFAGPEADARKYLDPFNALDPVLLGDGNVPYPDIAPAQMTGIDDPLCEGGDEHIQMTAGLQVYNLTTERQIYELLKSNINKYPELVNSWVVLEQYSVEAVLAVDPKSQSYPWRDDLLLTAIGVNYPPNPSLDPIALQWAKQTVDLWNTGQPTRKPSTYVNYALGNEPMEQWYGYEGWRLKKLRDLKKKYDPYGSFSYYNPITY